MNDTNTGNTNTGNTNTGTARVDQWLWSVRIYRTRSAATEACRAGHVRVNGSTAKPATQVKAGDEVSVRAAGRDRLMQISKVIKRRVGASVAAECLVDHSPPAPPRESRPLLERPRGAGRPTKTERRALDRFRGY